MQDHTYYLNIDSPVGRILLVAQRDTLIRLEFTDRPHAQGIPASATAGSPFLEEVHRQISAYFAGTLHRFDIPLRLQGTPFQQRVWQALSEIPFGSVSTYSHLANQIGRPTAVRAVGAANGQNPISIVVPCHRLIGKDGHLTGYAGGLEAKRWLLRHERHGISDCVFRISD